MPQSKAKSKAKSKATAKAMAPAAVVVEPPSVAEAEPPVDDALPPVAVVAMLAESNEDLAKLAFGQPLQVPCQLQEMQDRKQDRPDLAVRQMHVKDD